MGKVYTGLTELTVTDTNGNDVNIILDSKKGIIPVKEMIECDVWKGRAKVIGEMDFAFEDLFNLYLLYGDDIVVDKMRERGYSKASSLRVARRFYVIKTYGIQYSFERNSETED